MRALWNFIKKIDEAATVSKELTRPDPRGDRVVRHTAVGRIVLALAILIAGTIYYWPDG